MIYLDYNATTPCSERVLTAMLPYFTRRFGNPSSGHADGLRAHEAVRRARSQVASLLSCRPSEVVFTSGATEANHLAILGGLRAARAQGRGEHLIICSTEHKAVLGAADAAAEEGFSVTRLNVATDGRVSLDALSAEIRPDTSFCSVMLGNNETGLIQPVHELSRICRERGVCFHTDAAQAAGQIPLDIGILDVDFLSLSGHKMYAPKGIGALYVRGGRRAGRLLPLQHGGGQEFGLRGGTVPVPLVVGLGEACAETTELLASGAGGRIATLREIFWERISSRTYGLRRLATASNSLPNTIMIAFPDANAQAVVSQLGATVSCSSGSACNSGVPGPSHVLRALGDYPAGAVRFSLGRATTEEDLHTAADAAAQAVLRIRALEPAC